MNGVRRKLKNLRHFFCQCWTTFKKTGPPLHNAWNILGSAMFEDHLATLLRFNISNGASKRKEKLVLPISVQLVLLVRQGCEKTARGETVLNL
jgi:hypothetical protein